MSVVAFETVISERLDLAWYLRTARSREVTGVSSGFAAFDAITGGFQAGNLILVAGSRGIGKTSFALHAALSSGASRPTQLYSLQEPAHALADRYLCAQGRSSSARNAPGCVDARAAARAADLNFTIIDIPRLRLRQLREAALGAVRHHGLGLIVIDHIELLRPDTSLVDPVDALDEVARGLKRLAREIGCPVLATSQSGLIDCGHRRLSALREQDTISAHADVVALLHRPPGPDAITRHRAATIVKNRNGAVGALELPPFDQL